MGYDCVVIGGGAAGLTAAVLLGQAAHGRRRVLLLEKAPRPGKKLLATGNGTCNLTNTGAAPARYHGCPALAGAALAAFSPADTMAFFTSLGVDCRVREDGRVYPYSEQAAAVLDALRLETAALGVELCCQRPATALQRTNTGWRVITAAGADRVLTMDLHAAQIQGFFDIPVDHLLGNPTFVNYFLEKFPEEKYNHDEFVVVSPDVGSVSRARVFAGKVHMGLAIVDKRRQKANVCEVMNVIGDVRGKTCIIYDDMVDTAGSLCNAAAALVEVGGAKEVYACATHGVLSGPAYERIQNSVLKEGLPNPPRRPWTPGTA